MSTSLGHKVCLIINNHKKVYIVLRVFPRDNFVLFVEH